MKMFNTILIANRGEIAVRIIKSAKKLGIKSIAIFSEADKDSLHVRLADFKYCLSSHPTEEELAKTYLNIDKIIAAAKQFGAEAIHPGYGFLAESPLLVDACEKNGLVFIGPNTRAIELMGNKIEARAFIKNLEIPMTEGITGSPKELLKNASKIPLPILVKAAAGGGGKGMRIVRNANDLENILETTSREAKNYFGDGSIYIEKYVEEPRHIEFQIIGDNFGNVVHLFERECSIQRRYQKIIEESPSPTLNPEIREKMGNDAVKIAGAVNYNSAGTIEFLVDNKMNYYFLEMNTRIQVEHPVTEMVTGIDLVEEQIKIAAGNKLSFKQEELSQTGHAIECRIYAEDPLKNFMPSPGTMDFYHQPQGENIRIDTAIDKACTIHSFFDPMISKLVVGGNNRQEAIEKSINALDNYIIHGIRTNVSYLKAMLNHPAFAENKIATSFCDTNKDELLEAISNSKTTSDTNLALLAFALYSIQPKKESKNVWEEIGYWRNIMKLSFAIDEVEREIVLEERKNNNYIFSIDESTYPLEIINLFDNEIEFKYQDFIHRAFISRAKDGISTISFNGIDYSIERTDIINNLKVYDNHEGGSGANNLCSPMPGKVIKVNVKAGDKVTTGKVLLIVEAMKMENNIIATEEAIVEKILVKEGDMVDANAQLVFLNSENN